MILSYLLWARTVVASTPGRIFAFTLDLAKIRPGIDCMLENMPLSLITRLMKFHFEVHKLFSL